MKISWIGLLFMSLPSFAGQIYQCGDTFQDRPCQNNSQTKVVGNFEPEKLSAEEIKAKEEARAKLEAQAEADVKARYDAEVAAATKARAASYLYAKSVSAVRENKIIVGMSREDLIKSWGQPDHINQTVTSAGQRQQWVYITAAGRRYVYVSEGVITGWN